MARSITRTIGIVKGKSKAERIFLNLLDPDFRTVRYEHPHEYVQMYWDAYTSVPRNNAALNGKVFEIVIETLLYRENILPFYTQARAAFVPNVNYDILLYSKGEPVSLSLKTSLRERYKQADLEAVALKYVHRKSSCFLLTLNHDEAEGVLGKITKGDILGLDDIIDCSTERFDALVQELKSKRFVESETVKVIEGNLVKRID